MIRYGLFILMLFHLPSDLAAGSWLQEKGGAYAQAGVSWLQYSKLHNRFGPSVRLPRKVTDITIQYYMEYGLTKNFTLIAEVPFKLLKTGPSLIPRHDFTDPVQQGRLDQFGNIAIAGKLGLLKRNSWVISAKAGIAANTVAQRPDAGLRTGYDSWGMTPSLAAGYSRSFWYLTADAGIRVQTNGYSTFFFSQLEAGIKRRESWQLIGSISLLRSFYDGSFRSENSLQTGLYLNDQEYLALTLKAGRSFSRHMGAYLTASGGVLAHLVPEGILMMANVYYKW